MTTPPHGDGPPVHYATEYGAYVVADPRVCGGWPVVRGTRLTVGFLQALATKWTRAEILAEYTWLTPEGLDAALEFPAGGV